MNKIKLLVMSDIHAQFDRYKPVELPNADIAIVAGDITNLGRNRRKELNDAEVWFRGLAHKYEKVFYILGNHDLRVDEKHFELGSDNVFSLEETSYIYNGFKIGGINLSPCYDMPSLVNNWRNMTSNRDKEKEGFDKLEPDLDIVVSHCPPAGVLYCSLNWGSHELLKYIETNNPNLVVCGHIHEGAGIRQYNKTCVVNTAMHYQLIKMYE